MKKNDIKNMNKEDLNKKLVEFRNELQAFSFGTTAGKSKNVKSGRDLKRNIARILTSLNK